MDTADRPTTLEVPLPSNACTVCANLRRLFSDCNFRMLHGRGSLETLFETACPGHGPLFDVIRPELSQMLSRYDCKQDDATNDGATNDAQNGIDEDSGGRSEVGESVESKEGQSMERLSKPSSISCDVEFIWTTDYNKPVPAIWACPTDPNVKVGWAWPLAIARPCDEPQKPGFGRLLDPDWVDLELARQWKRDCLAQHGDTCRNPLKINTVSPAWVIDTVTRRIVPGADVPEYVALSYRWGNSAGFRTTRHILKDIQEPGAFSPGTELGDSMASIIQDAMELTRAIDERYLWVDAVCIVQDDQAHCFTQLELMGAIYATAKLTIVASDGDAVEGILGLKGISPPRQIHQQVIPIFETEKLIIPLEPDFTSGSSPYFDRAWTYQEFYLSQRRLIFARGQVHWHCSCADRRENFAPSQNTSIGLGYSMKMDDHISVLKGQPDFPALNSLLGEYNKRQLSFPEDALPGISGLLSILSRPFDGGFLFGLPEVAFDSALLWRRSHNRPNMEKREDSGTTNLLSLTSRLPSWSWISWRSSLYLLDEETYVTSHFRKSWTLPITQWYTHETPEDSVKRPIRSHWFSLREKVQNHEHENQLPEGWIRIKYLEGIHYQPPEGLGEYVYQHAAFPDELFWLPVPIATFTEGIDLLGPAQTPYISCNTKRGRFTAVRFPQSQFFNYELSFSANLFSVGVLNACGDYCGRLWLQGEDDILRFPEAGSSIACEVEIVAICRRREIKTCDNSWRPEGEEVGNQDNPIFKDVYGVLWVEWIDGIAYRRASGVVDKDEWEGYNLEDVELIMG